MKYSSGSRTMPGESFSTEYADNDFMSCPLLISRFEGVCDPGQRRVADLALEFRIGDEPQRVIAVLPEPELRGLDRVQVCPGFFDLRPVVAPGSREIGVAQPGGDALVKRMIAGRQLRVVERVVADCIDEHFFVVIEAYPRDRLKSHGLCRSELDVALAHEPEHDHGEYASGSDLQQHGRLHRVHILDYAGDRLSLLRRGFGVHPQVQVHTRCHWQCYCQEYA